jgi:hypothetical protein
VMQRGIMKDTDPRCTKAWYQPGAVLCLEFDSANHQAVSDCVMPWFFWR